MSSATRKPSTRSVSADANDGDELLPLTESDFDAMSDQEEANHVQLNDIHIKEKASPQQKYVEKEDNVTGTECGYCSFRPQCLQTFNNPKALLAFMCAFCMIQGFVVNGINNVNTTSIERRFELPSSRVGAISSAYDVSAAILGIIISYFGSGRNKARWIAVAALFMAFGSFTMALPHFITGRYEWGENVTETCTDSSTAKEKCSSTDESGELQRFWYLFLFGQALHGIGGTTLYIVGVALIDDSVPATSSPLYVGIMYAFATLGPALGYVVGGQFLDVYVDADVVDSVALTPEDPRWVGAWWIGFVAASVLFIVTSVPLFAYGVELPTARHVRETRVAQTHTDSTTEKVATEDLSKSVKDLPRSFWILIKNPAFIFITLAGTGEGFSTSGMATFLPKLIQNQFATTAAWASILGGLVAVPGAAGGQLVGGYVCKKWKLKVQGMIRLNIIVCIAALLLDLVVWVRCDIDDIAGVNTPYHQSESIQGLHSSCNNNCSCSTAMYEPVCSESGIQYFSPCHAGCSRKLDAADSYGNCSCITAMHSMTNLSSSSAVSGKCSTECQSLYLFLPILLLSIFFRFVESPPSLSVTLRCIHDSQRTFALGIQWFIARLLGTVPGPIFFGAVIDSTCLVWQEKCGEKASCWIYDNVALSRNFFIILVSVKIFTAVMFFLAYKFYNPPPEKSVSFHNCHGQEIVIGNMNDSLESNVTKNGIKEG